MKTHLFFSAALSLALFSGCASVQPTITATAKTTSPNDGAFIVRVLPNMASASQYFKNWGEVTVVRLPGNSSEKESSFSISPTLEGTSRTAIYAAPLPEGRYRFGQFSSMMCGYLCINAWLKIKPEFSQFEVKRGTLTDLGVLVQSNNPSDAKNVLLAHDTSENHPETPEIVRELVPGLTSTLANPRISWTPSTVPAEMPRLLAVTLANSYGFVSPQELADEKFLYGSANGVVYSWKLGQRAKPHNLNSRSSIETVLLASDGRWFVGGELSLLKASGDEGQTWHSARGNLPFGVITDLREWNTQLLATVLRGNEITIYTTPLAQTQWTEIAKYQMSVSLWDMKDIRPQSFLFADKLITTVPGRRVAVYDLKAGESTLQALPGAVTAFSVSADGVMRCRCTATFKVDPYESRDFGKTWKESSSSRFMALPTFKNRHQGVAFQGGFYSPSKMAYTEDGGTTWIESTVAPTYFSELFYAKNGATAYAVSPTGVFWRTRDDGKNWESVDR